MTYAKRTDANQARVVAEFRELMPDASLFVASGIGQGFPDLIVGFRGSTFCFELKDPAKTPSRRKLTRAQEEFFSTWQGHAAVVHSAAEIVAEIARARD